MFSCSLGEKARVSTGFSQYFLNLGGGGGGEEQTLLKVLSLNRFCTALTQKYTHILFFCFHTPFIGEQNQVPKNGSFEARAMVIIFKPTDHTRLSVRTSGERKHHHNFHLRAV